MISAGAVAKEGIARNSGAKKSESRKKNPVVIAVRPVRPPSAIPDEDSTKVVTVEVPRQAPAVVPIASASRAPRILGRRPCSSSIFALEAQPIRVPSVSNRSTNKKAKITEKKFRVNTFEKSSFIKVGASDAGAENTPEGMRV